MPRATGVESRLGRYEQAWEAINRLIRRGGSWSGHERNCFYLQTGDGRFENVSAVTGLDAIEDGRGVAICDYDRDGDLDIFLKSRNAPQVRLFRNEVSQRGHWLQLELRGKGANRQAIGARVTVALPGGRTRVKEIQAGTGFLSQSSTVLHFGLGELATPRDVTIRWPTGGLTRVEALAVDRRHTVEESPAAPSSPPPFEARRAGPAKQAEEAVPATRGLEPGADVGRSFWLMAPAPLPELELVEASGAQLRPERWKGKALALALYSPECPLCKEELLGWKAALGKTPGPVLPLAVTLARSGEPFPVQHPAWLEGIAAAGASARGGMALGVLLEEIAHWPREIPVPATVLLDVSGNIVKLYRGPVPWSQITADSTSIPATPEARLRAALPFPGTYHATSLRRNDFQLGVSFLEAGLEEEALAAFRRCLELDAPQADARYNVGVILQQRGDLEGALHQYELAVDQDPLFADAHSNLGVIFAQAGQLTAARASLERAVQLRPDHAEALINLGNVELASGRPAEALRVLARGAELEPDHVQIQKKLGDAYRRVGDVDRARVAYERVTRLAPADAEGWSNLGVLLAESGKLDEALSICRKAVQVGPRSASARNNLGLLLDGMGKSDEAARVFEEAMALEPKLAAPHLNLARSHLRRGQAVRAQRVLERFLRTSPGHPGALDLLRRTRGE